MGCFGLCWHLSLLGCIQYITINWKPWCEFILLKNFIKYLVHIFGHQIRQLFQSLWNFLYFVFCFCSFVLFCFIIDLTFVALITLNAGSEHECLHLHPPPRLYLIYIIVLLLRYLFVWFFSLIFSVDEQSISIGYWSITNVMSCRGFSFCLNGVLFVYSNISL